MHQTDNKLCTVFWLLHMGVRDQKKHKKEIKKYSTGIKKHIKRESKNILAPQTGARPRQGQEEDNLQMRWATLYIVSFHGGRSAECRFCGAGGGEGTAPPPQSEPKVKNSTTKEITRNYIPYRPFSEGHLKVHKRT